MAAYLTTTKPTSRSNPLGATIIDGGVNFSIYSRNATEVEIVFFDHEDDGVPSHVVRIDPVTNRTYNYWHTFIPDVSHGQIYGFRIAGPSIPEMGLYFDIFSVARAENKSSASVPEHNGAHVNSPAKALSINMESSATIVALFNKRCPKPRFAKLNIHS